MRSTKHMQLLFRALSWMKIHISYEGLAYVFCKEPNSKYFRLWVSYSICYKYSTLLSYTKSCRRQYIPNWQSYVPINPYLQKQAAGQIYPWTIGHQLLSYTIIVISLGIIEICSNFYTSFKCPNNGWLFACVFLDILFRVLFFLFRDS